MAQTDEQKKAEETERKLAAFRDHARTWKTNRPLGEKNAHRASKLYGKH